MWTLGDKKAQHALLLLVFFVTLPPLPPPALIPRKLIWSPILCADSRIRSSCAPLDKSGPISGGHPSAPHMTTDKASSIASSRLHVIVAFHWLHWT
jgi:hypothetical protein